MIEDVTLVSGAQVSVRFRWRGGQTQSFSVDKPRPIALMAGGLLVVSLGIEFYATSDQIHGPQPVHQFGESSVIQPSVGH